MTRRGRIRLLVGLALTATTAAAAVLAVHRYDPLGYAGGTIGGETPLLLGFSDPGTSGSGQRTIYYAYVPNGEIRVQFGIRNEGDIPVVVDGLTVGPGRTDLTDWIFASAELRLPPAPTLDSLPLTEPSDGRRWYSEPFRRFELGPHAATTLELVLRLRHCPTAGATPTRAPGATPFVGAPGWAFSSTLVDALPIHYTVLGDAHTSLIPLPEMLGIMFTDGYCANPDVPEDSVSATG